MNAYRRNLDELFKTFRRYLRPETVFIWTTALPVSESVRGGVILDTIRFLQDVLRYDICLANDISSHAALSNGFDVVDLHFEMRRHIHMRLGDGIHWNAKAHRKITGILLRHICFALDILLPVRVSCGFDRLLYSSSYKSGDSLLETPAGDERRDASSSRSTEVSSRVDSEQRTASSSAVNDGLLPTPVSRPRPALGRRGRQHFHRFGDRILSAPSMSVTHDEDDARSEIQRLSLYSHPSVS